MLFDASSSVRLGATVTSAALPRPAQDGAVSPRGPRNDGTRHVRVPATRRSTSMARELAGRNSSACETDQDATSTARCGAAKVQQLHLRARSPGAQRAIDAGVCARMTPAGLKEARLRASRARSSLGAPRAKAGYELIQIASGKLPRRRFSRNYVTREARQTARANVPAQFPPYHVGCRPFLEQREFRRPRLPGEVHRPGQTDHRWCRGNNRTAGFTFGGYAASAGRPLPELIRRVELVLVGSQSHRTHLTAHMPSRAETRTR